MCILLRINTTMDMLHDQNIQLVSFINIKSNQLRFFFNLPTHQQIKTL